MYDKLEYMHNVKDEEEKSTKDEGEEEDSVDYLLDITDKFLTEEEYPKNFDIKIIENFHISEKLNKLSSFLNLFNLSKESNSILKLANYSVLERGEELRDELKNRILAELSDPYSEKYFEWNYETDFENLIDIGFNDLEKNFIETIDQGLIYLYDLNIDNALETLWTAYSLQPEGHHDFDDNIISLQLFNDEDLNRQTDAPGRGEVYEIRAEIIRKFSEWIENREPNFEDLETLSLEDLADTIVKNYPNLDTIIDEINEEWDEFIDSLTKEQKTSMTEEEVEPYVPEELSEYTDTSFPEHYEFEEPVGTSGDLERLEEKLLSRNFDDLEDYI
jgi:hypothetical protein